MYYPKIMDRDRGHVFELVVWDRLYLRPRAYRWNLRVDRRRLDLAFNVNSGRRHDRMPVLLKPDQFEHWLSGDMGVDVLRPAPNDYLQRRPASKRVNSSKADKDDASLIEQIETVAAA